MIHHLKGIRPLKFVVAGMIAAAMSIALAQSGFTLSSPDLQNGIQSEQVFSNFGCTGGNISPELDWTGAPEATKSFAVTLFDPDARAGKGWWHWLIYNIPANTTHLAKNAGDPDTGLAPSGSVQGVTGFGTPGYGGPCPPQGDPPHHYTFTVYALDTAEIDFPQDASATTINSSLQAHTLAKATLIVMFSR